MKKNLIKILVLGLVLTITSCGKDYLSTDPEKQLTDEQMFSNINNARAALNGTYRLLYQQLSGEQQDGHTSIMISMDYLGEDVVMSGRGTDAFYYTYRWLRHRETESAQVLFAYRLYYRIISNANIILERIDSVPDATAMDKQTIKGEALALRAFGHFMLVQLFGKRYDGTNYPQNPVNSQFGVPIMLKHSLLPQNRATVEANYFVINQDLDNAIILLDGAPKRPYKTHIDKSVALGLKARVLLTQERFAEAVTVALQAVQGYDLMSNREYLSGFNNIQNDEWMWGITQKEEQIPTEGSFYGFMSSNFNSVHTRTNAKMINKQLYNSISATDIRKKMWCDDPNDVVNFPGIVAGNSLKPIPNQMRVQYMHNKFRVSNPVSRAGDIPLMRASEMYLIAAEGYVRSSPVNNAEAANTLYRLAKQRDTAYTLSESTGNTLRGEIWDQRRIELWGEGFRFLDLKRQNLALSRGNRNTTGVNSSWASVTSVAAGDNRWQWKIPQREKDANPSMPQNP